MALFGGAVTLRVEWENPGASKCTARGDEPGARVRQVTAGFLSGSCQGRVLREDLLVGVSKQFPQMT